MISIKEYEKLVDEVLVMEKELERLGRVRYKDVSSGEEYAMHEEAIRESYPPQKEYSDYKKIYLEKKRLIEAFDMIARYALAINNNQADRGQSADQ